MRSIINLPAEDRTTDIGNVHKKFGNGRARGSVDILSDRHADRQTPRQTYSSQYFATAPACEVNKVEYSLHLLYTDYIA